MTGRKVGTRAEFDAALATFGLPVAGTPLRGHHVHRFESYVTEPDQDGVVHELGWIEYADDADPVHHVHDEPIRIDPPTAVPALLDLPGRPSSRFQVP